MLTRPVADLHHLDTSTFWFVMAHQNGMHRYHADGEFHTYKDTPKSIGQMQDTPFNRLQGRCVALAAMPRTCRSAANSFWRIPSGEPSRGPASPTISPAKTRSASHMPG
ncbi:MAG: hypothetical protein J0H21_03850 [Rhizobiales bacterium]|nr:hypothetical protein [Hyphomicrobiales bacterium]